MNVEKFSTVRYFSEAYFNCSMDESDLESLVGDFLMREAKQTIEAFKNEVEILYMYALEGTMPLEDITGILTGKRGVSKQGAESVIKLFFTSIQKIKFRNICYFFNCYYGCYIGLFDLQSRIEEFLMWENIMTLDEEINKIYKVNDPKLRREVTDLENCLQTFFMRDTKEKVESFRKEIEAVYTLIGKPELMKGVAYRFGGDIRIPDKKAVCVIKLLYDNIERSKQLFFQ